MKAFLSVLLVAMLVGCITPPSASISNPGSVGGAVDEKKVCKVDADCVAETCCHARRAVNAPNAPNCTDVACTMDCEPGTVDCGQGYFACSESEQCVVILY
ncbi:hypothetical protein ACFLQ2_04305 [archaeon]